MAERPAYIQANKLRFLRPYQLKAIHRLQAAVKDGKDRFLFEMATGTGKTLTEAAVVKLFLEDQAKKAFAAVLSPDFQTVIYKRQLAPSGVAGEDAPGAGGTPGGVYRWAAGASSGGLR